MPFYWVDLTYILVILAVIFSIWASVTVNQTFKRYSKQRPQSGMTGYDAARRVLNINGLSHVKIEHITGNLTDHFDPKANVIRLSDSVYSVSSTAAVGVAAHEAGHAIQYATHYSPLKIRNAIYQLQILAHGFPSPLSF